MYIFDIATVAIEIERTMEILIVVIKTGTRLLLSGVRRLLSWWVPGFIDTNKKWSMLTVEVRLLESRDWERPLSSTLCFRLPLRTTPTTSAVTRSRSTVPSRSRSPRQSWRRSSSKVVHGWTLDRDDVANNGWTTQFV